MNEKQIKELIKIKEAEIKALKQQLQELEVKEEKINYMELSKKDNKEIISTLENLELKEIKKIAKQGKLVVVPNNKEKAINLLIETIETRNNKGCAFR